MTFNSMIPAIRRGLGRANFARGAANPGSLHNGRSHPSPLTREETRLAVIEVLG
jgi:hypothetical protein